MKFSKLKIKNWRQFSDVEIEFHDRLTVLTGTNGAGKTTLLNTLSRTIGWQIHMLSANFDDQKLRTTLQENASRELDLGDPPSGTVELDDGALLDLGIGKKPSTLQAFGPLRGVDGVYLTSHRPFLSYSPVSHVPTRIGTSLELLNQYTQRSKKAFNPVPTQEVVKSEQTPSHKLKETLIAAATFGEGNSTVEGDDELKSMLNNFSDIMRSLLPDEIGFKRLMVRIPEIYVVSNSGVFPFEATSGGMAAIIDLSWQIFLAARSYAKFSVLIDEPENHLHPALQKRLLSDLMRAFPSVQFVIATHSPLMITSVEDSTVYALRPNKDRSISAHKLDLIEKSASATETLDRVLGVNGNAPSWASEKLDKVVEDFLPRLSEPNVIQELRERLEYEGLKGDFTRVIARLSEQNDS